MRVKRSEQKLSSGSKKIQSLSVFCASIHLPVNIFTSWSNVSCEARVVSGQTQQVPGAETLIQVTLCMQLGGLRAEITEEYKHPQVSSNPPSGL